jgi:putative SOS response-associated peptidase YedK
MCGRYALYAPTSELQRHFEASTDELQDDLSPRYNAAPMQWLPVVRQRPSGERVVHLLRWGLVPSWSRDESIATRLINARGETLAEKASFRAAYKSRRCIVPASGFYEWKREGKEKQPYYAHPTDGKLLGFAGLWEQWSLGDGGDCVDTFTVVTTDANDTMKPLHARMPVILAPSDYAAWLTKGTNPGLLTGLVVPCPDAMLQVYPVSKAVGGVANDGPELIKPIVV